MKVHNQCPTIPSTSYRIAFVGEAPGRDEEASGTPFIGMSGRLLNALLSKANIVRAACFVGNVCQTRPEGNQLANLDWTGPEIQSGLAQLRNDLNLVRPNLVVCLGSVALHAFKSPLEPPKKRKTKTGPTFVFPNSIDNWRGSLFLSEVGAPLEGVKCLATHHPAYCLRMYENVPLLMMDLNKAAKQGGFPELHLPKRVLEPTPTLMEIISMVNLIRKEQKEVSLDIEGGLTGISCCSIATSPFHSFNIPFIKLDGSSYWTVEEEAILLEQLSNLLVDPHIPKVFQNGLYDRFVLQYGFNMPVLGNSDDTMVKWWEKYCELGKSLAMQCSVLTDEPFYKSERKSDSQETFYSYCCKDSTVTFEINKKLDDLLENLPTCRAHYALNMNILNVFLYMELRGIRYNTSLARHRLEEVNNHIYLLQHALNIVCGCGLSPDALTSDLFTSLQAVMCWKGNLNKVKKGFEGAFLRCTELIKKDTLTEEDLGFLSIQLGLDMNIRSVDFKDFLYNTLKLPQQTNPKTGMVTTDYNALLKLQKKTKHPAISLAIEIGSLRMRAQMLEISADSDGRVRCGYNAVGTVTGRISCYTSPTGSGYNLQTIPDKDVLKPQGHPMKEGMRDLFMADEDHWFFQCDLKGSDGWTIGAHLNALGDSTMLDDLRFGIKPASRVCYMLRHGSTSLKGKQRLEVKELLKEVKKEDWDYFACKIGIWGICYLMGPDLLANQILEESDGRIQLSRSQVAEFHRAVFEGYRVKLWHDWMARTLAKKPELHCASGMVRRFFGRTQELLGEALATEPQANTTYAINLAANQLWNDPKNRVADKLVIDGRGNYKKVPFKVEPLHQVHDALNGQFLKRDTTWAIGKINQWFNNTLTIAGQNIIIPFEGNYGSSWGQLDEGTI